MAPNIEAAETAARRWVGQRRYVTVLFSDVSGSSEHAERLEAEEYADLLGRFRTFARDIIPGHGGSIARLQGDGLLALFGHLESSEEDGRRATQAALDLHDAVAQLRVGSGVNASSLQLHSGIHAGLVLLLDGDIETGRFDVVGEVPNTAARLCHLAGSGEILVSDESLGPQAHFFRLTELRGLPIRGRADPLNVMRIEGRSVVERRIDAAAVRGVVPFVGRGAILDALFLAREQSLRGEASAVVLCGEAGIGKTRAIDEFLRRTESSGSRVLRGYCENFLGAEPLQPFVHWLRSALGWQAGASPENNEAAVGRALAPFGGERAALLAAQAHALLSGRRPAATPSPATTHHALITELVELLARQRPLILVLDDWQWADDASKQVLSALRARRLPVMLLLATRPVEDEEPALADAPVLHMQALDLDETTDTISSWLPDANPFVIQEIFRQSGGSPLFIEELCHAAAAGRELRSAPHSPGVAWINALVGSRLAHLPPSLAEGLRVASILGTRFETWLLERVLGSGEAAGLLEAMQRLDFLVPDTQPGMLRFKHVLTRDAVYATVPLQDRRALHLRVAALLHASLEGHDAFEWLEALSYHFDAACSSREAAQFAEAAGDKALAAMALDRGRAQYITALRGLDALPDLSREAKLRWCRIAQKLGQTCVFDALDVDECLTLFKRAATLAREVGDENVIARAEYWLAYVSYGKGQPRRAVLHCEAALQHAAASDDSRLLVQIQATLGQALASAGRYDEALPLLRQAVESKRQHSRPGSGMAVGSAYTVARMGYTLGDLGRFDEAHECFAESLRLLGEPLHAVKASVLELICAVHLWQGRWSEAQTEGLRGAEMALRCRSRFNNVMGHALAACAGWAAHGDPASLQTLRESTHWIERRGGAISTSLNYGWLVEATVALGLEQEARRHAARLLMRARAHDRQGEAQGHRAMARLASAQGDRARAQRCLAAADRAAQLRGSPRELAVNTLARAECAVAFGQATDARSLAESAGEAFEAMKMSTHLERARSLVGVDRSA
jgi:class 3 adenylate cyclase/tetratricopeptide (TPR) repeat protein